MKTSLTVLAASFALLTVACNPQPPHAPTTETPAAPAATAPPPAESAAPAAAPAAPKLQADLRALWHGHIDKTRDYAMAVKAGNQSEADAAASAVVTNAKAISAAVAGFYGEAGGAEMLRLLGGHWAGVKAMTDAAHKGDATGVQKAMDQAIANAGDIASFLASANPHLPKDTVNALMVTHVEHHHAQITQIMAGDEVGEAATWKAMQAHMDVISDALAAAIAQQFPDKAA
ncbi:hypothetical protein [Stenotrophomonas sp. YIM B06876]|uniref:hypothetical protein n=1 Tax=Stenotrophomonas sp. YIM B06876 TaxID=3060211 RepID=UPI00273990FB|nr:hypothetical protein [Stenotrophomonas sp. YIM B06876]